MAVRLLCPATSLVSCGARRKAVDVRASRSPSSCEKISRSTFVGVRVPSVVRQAVLPRGRAQPAVRASFPGMDNVPKQFRVDNLSEIQRQNFANVPPSLYGLTTSQMDMFVDSESPVRRGSEGLDVETLRASYHYRDHGVWSKYALEGGVDRPRPIMGASGGGMEMSYRTKAHGRVKGAPPDLPSLLLNSRICYIGMPIVQAVTELVVAELLWLNWDAPDKPIYVYINSPGTQNEDRESVAFETEAYAIADTLLYVKPKIHTLVIGHAYGQAAMLATIGTKGHRFMLPNARMKLYSPKTHKSMGNATDVWIKAKELEANTRYYAGLLSHGTGKDYKELMKELGRPRYFSADEAVEYGLVDRVLRDKRGVLAERRDYDQMLMEGQKMRGERGVGQRQSGLQPKPAVR